MVYLNVLSMAHAISPVHDPCYMSCPWPMLYGVQERNWKMYGAKRQWSV